MDLQVATHIRSRSELGEKLFCAWCTKEIVDVPAVINQEGLLFCSLEHGTEAANRMPPNSTIPIGPKQAAAPLVGEVVLYVLPSGPNRGSIRPATIVSVSGPNSALLYVLTAGTIDGPKWSRPQLVLAGFSSTMERDTWHRRT